MGPCVNYNRALLTRHGPRFAYVSHPVPTIARACAALIVVVVLCFSLSLLSSRSWSSSSSLSVVIVVVSRPVWSSISARASTAMTNHQNPCLNKEIMETMKQWRQETKETLVNTFKESALILVYEFLGSICFTLLYINTASERALAAW